MSQHKIAKNSLDFTLNKIGLKCLMKRLIQGILSLKIFRAPSSNSFSDVSATAFVLSLNEKRKIEEIKFYFLE